MGTSRKVSIFWFRRDLRTDDNRAFFKALSSGHVVLPLFILDTRIVSELPSNDHRLGFIYSQLENIHRELKKAGCGLLVKRGSPVDVFRDLVGKYDISAVYCNKDHEGYGIERDREVASFLSGRGSSFHSFLDHLIMERDEVLKDDGSPYRVFTPYARRWRSLLESGHLKHYPSENLFEKLYSGEDFHLPSMKELGIKPSGMPAPPRIVDSSLIKEYDKYRDYPAAEGTTRLGVHLRFGTLSIRSLVREAAKLNEVFLNELIWREFYAMILWHFPYVNKSSFKPEYDRINWLNDEEVFSRWTSGTTGYPFVDAGMRQLNDTGYMHNRLRMITASFLTKHLLTDWRWGEAYFAQKLFDYELSSNNGGWQWSAGSGCDAAPYFRIFNPVAQQKKFDPRKDFIRKWVKEYGSNQYPAPVVDHVKARERCLKAYKAALSY